MNKVILNIVFYKYYGEKETDKKACIFYSDGTVANVSFDEGIDACEEICRVNHIKTKDAFKEMINHDIVHVMSGKDFEERFNSFLGIKPEIKHEEVLSNSTVVTPQVGEEATEESKQVKDDDFVEALRQNIPEVGSIPVIGSDDETKKVVPTEASTEDTTKSDTMKNVAAAATAVGGAAAIANQAKKEEADETSDLMKAREKALAAEKAKAAQTSANEKTPKVAVDEEIEDKPEKKEGIFKRAINKLKKNKLVKRIGVCVTALAMTLGFCGCASAANRKSLEGEMYNSNLPGMETTIDKDDFYTADHILLARYNNDKYDDYGYNQLLEVTHNKFQKEQMINVRDALVGFNDIFSRYYIQDGVRPSLKWDEVVAMHSAYNDWTKDEIRAYFNGAEIHSEDMSRAYKDASLQLMGAYAIETREHPVDVSMLIDSEEGKEFYERYHEAFLQCKEATRDEKLEKVKAFYDMVRRDFPVTEPVRTEGISHAENYEMLESYMLSVVPMISATEMMYQNLPTDYTLNDKEVAWFNDLGLCNRADKTFERIETICLMSEEDNKNPLYEQFRSTMIDILMKNNMYYVDDETRELTKLDKFQDAVNWHINEKGFNGGKGTGKGTTTTTTEQVVTTHTDTETTYHEEVTRVEKPIPADVKAQIDAEIEAENARAKAEAERAAEAERQRLQAEADREAERIRQQVQKDAEDMQRRIDEANKDIDSGKTVNEDDFGDHGVQFDPEHQDGNGNLNDSVENITTDPTGDQTGQPLPDPNQTGAQFDAQAPAYNAQAASTSVDSSSTQYRVQDSTGTTTTEQVSGGWIETTPVEDGYYYEDSWVEEEPYSAAVDQYVEGLSNTNAAEGEEISLEEAYQYTK